MLTLENGHMTLKVVAMVVTDLETGNNIAIVSRTNDRTFIVVRGLQMNTDKGTCEWDYALQYDIETFEEAKELMFSKLD